MAKSQYIALYDGDDELVSGCVSNLTDVTAEAESDVSDSEMDVTIYKLVPVRKVKFVESPVKVIDLKTK